jgi:hypothetical protein
MNQSQQHRATPEQWEVIGICKEEGKIPWPTATCLLELRARIEALEAAQLEQAESHRFCTDAITRRVEALEAVQRNQQLAMTELRAASAEVRPAGGLVERDPECVANWPDCYEGGYDPSCCRFPKSCSCEVRRPLPNPVAEAQPAGLVERVEEAIITGMVDGDRHAARAAIREVAAASADENPFDLLNEAAEHHGWDAAVAWLEQEADR